MASCVCWCSFNLLEVKEKTASEPSSSFWLRFLLPPPGFPAWPSFWCLLLFFWLLFFLFSFLSCPWLLAFFQAFSLVCCWFHNLLLRFSIAPGGVFLASLSRFLAFFQAFCMGFLFRSAWLPCKLLSEAAGFFRDPMF